MALDELGPLVLGPTIETLFADWPQNLKDRIEEDFYQSLNRAEIEYSKCKELFVKPGDEELLKRLLSRKRSIGGMNQLADNIANIMERLRLPSVFPS
ncbi:MAG: hypothetical protein JSV16_14365 [Candidatus Hydrogenedentota bacterium]|nr:MAG: hypothetical protein JSV16_14365 [Candidatus Hydrogenedentota bacterium]